MYRGPSTARTFPPYSCDQYGRIRTNYQKRRDEDDEDADSSSNSITSTVVAIDNDDNADLARTKHTAKSVVKGVKVLKQKSTGGNIWRQIAQTALSWKKMKVGTCTEKNNSKGDTSKKG